MNDQELLRGARECTTISGDCANCPFDRHIGADGAHCPDLLVRALAERVEKLSEHSARYAEELAVIQERERWITVEERLPEEAQKVLTLSATGGVRVMHLNENGYDWSVEVSQWHGFLIPFNSVTHWMPLPEPPKEVEERNG